MFSSNRSTRHGLTLIELVVVIAILAALAGVLVPLLPSVINRTHASTGATNLGEIAKAVQLYAGLNADNYPGKLDNLATTTTSDGKTTNGVASFVPTDGSSLTTGTLSPADASALSGAGITHVAQLVTDPGAMAGGYDNWSPTFFPYGNDSSNVPGMGTMTKDDNLSYYYSLK